MPFVSHARNLQDLQLWRALRHVQQGFYIDVGAGDPQLDSVTHAFYQRGWRGMNLEPSRMLHDALCLARPADINLRVVAGAAATDPVTFYDVEGTLDSTTDAQQARRASDQGAVVVRRQLPGAALSALCDTYVTQSIHFLSIGAGVDAAAVLAGLDLTRHRPWILVLDAAAAATLAPGAIAAGYLAAFNDSVMAYYVASEQTALAAALFTPLAADERFVLCPDHPHAYPLTEWRARVAALEQQAADAELRAQQARDWAAAHVTEHDEQCQQQLHTLEQQCTQRLDTQALQAEQRAQEWHAREQALLAQSGALEHQVSHLTVQERGERERAERAEQLLASTSAHNAAERYALLHSMSWRITAPLRTANARVRALPGLWRDLSWQVRHRIAMSRRAMAGWPKRLIKRAVRAVMARPRLFFFLRHHAGRHPRLVNWLRVTVHRARAPEAVVETAPPGAELDHLSVAARDVLADLQRSVQRHRAR